MKLGEKKTLVLEPKDAYGEAFTTQDVPAKYFQDVFTQTVPRDNFKDIITQTVPLSALGEKGKDLVIGKVIEAGSTKATVTKIEGDNVTVDINNTQNPFYGKKIVVGLKSTFEGNTVIIKKLTNTDVTLEVINKANPFYGKKIVVGLKSTFEGNTVIIKKLTNTDVTLEVINKANPFYGKKIKEGMEGVIPNGGKTKILKITKETITIGVPNTHELGGKTLKFDVEIKSIE
jgi:FKBP-type peptidyl-prolyl cis-trans isomerase 2